MKKGISKTIIWTIILLIILLMIVAMFYFSSIKLIKKVMGI